MTIINIHEAKTHFSDLVARAQTGEEIIIAKAGSPVLRLVPFKQKKKARKPGSAKGKIRISADFNTPLPKNILKHFS